MRFDGSDIFVLLMVVGIVIVLAWAEIHSRRRQKTDSAAAPPDEPQDDPPAEPTPEHRPRERRRHRKGR